MQAMNWIVVFFPHKTVAVNAQTSAEKEIFMKKKVLIVVTSHSKLGETGDPTGYYLPEVSHPYFAMVEKGIEVDIASPLGGKAPLDEGSRDLSDPINRAFLESKVTMEKLENTLKLSKVRADEYAGILFAGGHGTMWDFAQDATIPELSATIYKNGGIVSAVCHGPAALLNIKNSDGTYLITGKEVTGFSNAEEEAAELTSVMPFLLETELKKRGASYSSAPLWQGRVVVSHRIVTGQNPASAHGVGVAVASLLN